MELETRNVLIHSIAFFFLFTAFQTTQGINQKVIKSFQNETLTEQNKTKITELAPSYQFDSFTATCILYAVFSIVNWLAPVIVAFLNNRLSMFGGALCYTFSIAAYIWPTRELLYFSSVVVGFGAAVLWTAQGAFISENSNDKTRQRNAGIFWAFLQSSLIFGNIYVYVKFQGQETIPSELRQQIYSIFAGATVIAAAGFLCVKNAEKKVEKEDGQSASEKIKYNFFQALKLAKTSNMLIGCVMFDYTGIVLSFWSGVFPSNIVGKSVEAKYMGFTGIAAGIGQVIGGLAFSMVPSIAKKFKKQTIVCLGAVCHLIAFGLIYANAGQNVISCNDKYTDEKPEGEKCDSPGYFPSSSVNIFYATAILLGFGDCCFNTQIYNHLGWYYSDCAAAAFGIMKSVQSLMAAGMFLISSDKVECPLYTMLTLLAGMAVISAVSFYYLSVKTEKERNSEEDKNSHNATAGTKV